MKTKKTDRKLSTKAKLAYETFTGVVEELKKTGNVKASPDIIAKRKKICNMCPELIKGKCQVCGCFMNLKSELAGARCPLGHWRAKIMEEAMLGSMSKIDKTECCK